MRASLPVRSLYPASEINFPVTILVSARIGYFSHINRSSTSWGSPVQKISLWGPPMSSLHNKHVRLPKHTQSFLNKNWPPLLNLSTAWHLTPPSFSTTCYTVDQSKGYCQGFFCGGMRRNGVPAPLIGYYSNVSVLAIFFIYLTTTKNPLVTAPG